MNAKQEQLFKKCIFEKVPYNILCECKTKNGGFTDSYRCTLTPMVAASFFQGEEMDGGNIVIEIKPYLRQMENMSKSEAIEYDSTFNNLEGLGAIETLATFDWLNANGFDYRGIIHLGLAYPATDEVTEIYRRNYAKYIQEKDSLDKNGFGMQMAIDL